MANRIPIPDVHTGDVAIATLWPAESRLLQYIVRGQPYSTTAIYKSIGPNPPQPAKLQYPRICHDPHLPSPPPHASFTAVPGAPHPHMPCFYISTERTTNIFPASPQNGESDTMAAPNLSLCHNSPRNLPPKVLCLTSRQSTKRVSLARRVASGTVAPAKTIRERQHGKTEI
jgi:hypothetical protein